MITWREEDADRADLAQLVHELKAKDPVKRAKAYLEFMDAREVLIQEGIDFSTFLLTCREQ